MASAEIHGTFPNHDLTRGVENLGVASLLQNIRQDRYTLELNFVKNYYISFKLNLD